MVGVARGEHEEAAEEEKRNVIERGSFHEGVPTIAVIVDGGVEQTHTQTFNGWRYHNHRHTHW